MKKFDQVFESALYSLKEQNYTNSTFIDNISLLLKLLADNDYVKVQSEEDMKRLLNHIMNQTDNVKELALDTTEKGLPPIKLLLKQDSDSESFSVTAINTKKPEEQKEFANSMLETIFQDVLDYIKTISLQGIQPEAALDELPPTEGSETQPGAEKTALPTVNTPKAV